MLEIDTKRVTEAIVAFLKSSFEKAGFSKALIALSGGVDSATSAALAVRALGKESIFPLLLPYGSLNPQGGRDAKKVIEAFHIPQTNTTEIDIKPLVDSLLALDHSIDNIRRGNIMARVRMTVLFDQAKKRQALVVGTENKSEHILGYFTRFGDSASDIEPLRNLYKTQVYQLANYLSIPQTIVEKAPTAGLWEGQTDEGEFGFTYKEADEILFQLYDEKKTIDQIVASGVDRTVVEKVQSWVYSHSFKHNLPIIP